MANAPRSSGRVARSVPLGALPTAVRTALTMTASLMTLLPPSVSQRLAGFEREGNPLLGFPFAAQRQERLALEIEQILLAHGRAGRDAASAQHMRHFIGYVRIVLADKFSLAHGVDAELERGQHTLAG